MKRNEGFNSFPLKFYWQVIGGLCEKLVLDLYQYRIFCELVHIHHDVRDMLELNRSNEDVQSYLTLVNKLQEKLQFWKQNFMAEKCTFDEIQEFEDVAAVCHVLDNKEYQPWVAAKEGFINCHQRISHFLIRRHPKQKW